jgi:hypothetical protein
MKPCFPNLRSGLLLLTLLASGCVSDPGPLSPDPGKAPSSAQVAVPPSREHLVVVKTEEIDWPVDGSIDYRAVTTTWYDAHGNLVREVLEGGDPSEYRRTSEWVYNQHGNLMSYVIDELYAPSFSGNRTALTTLETDGRSNPTRQLLTQDHGIDGTIDVQDTYLNKFDSRSNLVEYENDGVTRILAYDAHGNLVLFSDDWGDLITWTYNPHNTLVHQLFTLGSFAMELFTTAYDKHGNPTGQVLEFRYASVPAERSIFSLTYDGRHNLLTSVMDHDREADGTIDDRTTTTFEHSGNVEFSAIRRSRQTPGSNILATGSLAVPHRLRDMTLPDLLRSIDVGDRPCDAHDVPSRPRAHEQ